MLFKNVSNEIKLNNPCLFASGLLCGDIKFASEIFYNSFYEENNKRILRESLKLTEFYDFHITQVISNIQQCSHHHRYHIEVHTFRNFIPWRKRSSKRKLNRIYINKKILSAKPSYFLIELIIYEYITLLGFKNGHAIAQYCSQIAEQIFRCYYHSLV